MRSLARAAGGPDGRTYTVSALASHGFIAGKIGGAAPHDTSIAPTHDLSVCRPFTESLVPSRDGGVGNSVVWLVGVESGPADDAPRRVRVMLDGCRLDPRVQRVAAGGTDSHGNHHIYEVLNYKPLGTSLILLALVLFVALPLIFAGQLGWVRLFVRLSPGTLPDHQPLTPTSGNSSPQQQSDGSTPASSSHQSLQMVDLVIGEEEDVA